METEKQIKTLAKLMIEAADIAENLYDDPNIKGREQRMFGRIVNRLHSEWWSLCVHYNWFNIPEITGKRDVERHWLAKDIAESNRKVRR